MRVFMTWGWGAMPQCRGYGGQRVTHGDGSHLRLYVDSRDELRLSGLYLMGHLTGPSTLLTGINSVLYYVSGFSKPKPSPTGLP